MKKTSWVYQQSKTPASNIAAICHLSCGVLSFLFFVTQQSLIVRFLFILLFYVCARLQGKRIRHIYFLITLLAVAISHLFVPNGAVLFYVFSFPVTIGALTTGVYRSQTFVGMVFFSLASVHRSIHLPSKFGALLVRMLGYFESLFVQKKDFTRNRGNIAHTIGKKLSALLYTPAKEITRTSIPPFSYIFCICWTCIGLLLIASNSIVISYIF